jgi:predicted nucleotidyltransferase
MPADPGLIDRLRDAISRSGQVTCALLFGSRARGSARPDSDVDVAFLPSRPDVSLRDELDLQARLERAAGATVDLVRLDTAPTLVKWQVARAGLLIWADSPTAESCFRAEAAIEWDDMRDNFEDGARRYAMAVAAGGSR